MCIKVKVKLVSYLFSVVVFIVCALMAGCSHVFSGKARQAYTVPENKVQQIDTLKLPEVKKVEEEKSIIVQEDEDAPPQLKLSLEECRALTLENNLDLKVQLIEPAIAAESISEAEAKYEAVFSIYAQYQKTNRPGAGFLDEISGNKNETTYVDYGLEKLLSTGGSVSLNMTDVRTKSDAVFYSKYNPRYSPGITASISQPLLRDAGKRATTYTIRIAEYNSQMSSARTKMEAIKIITEIDRAYWTLYAARRLLEVREQEYKLAKDLTEETKRLVEVGVKPKIELIRISAREAESLEAIISTENSVRDWERNLKLKLNKPGLGTNTSTELILTTEPDPVRYEFNRKEIVKRAIENRMDMLLLELELARDESTIEYNRNQLHPSLDLTYDYGINSIGASRHDSYNMLLDNEYKDHTVTLELSMSLGNKAAKSRLRKAEYERTKRLTGRENKKAQIEYEVLGDIDQLEAAWQSILATRQTTIYRGRQYKAEKRQYELGMQTSRDVLLAQKDLADAQRREIVALTGYQRDLIDLASSTGTLLGAAKVELEPMKK